MAITGVVQDLMGMPLTNATVVAHGVRASTDTTGSFTIAVTPPSADDTYPIEVRADADGFSMRTRRVDGSDPLVFRLPPEATISGHVVDASTGRAVPHATVSDGEVSTTTDASGRFALAVDAPAVGLEAVALSRRGEAWFSLGFGEHLDGVAIEVAPRITVRARIEQIGPAPCLDVLSFAELEGDRFRFELSPGWHQLEIGCGQRETVFASETDLEVTWRVGPGGTVRGRLVVEDAAALAAARIVLEREGARTQDWPSRGVEPDGTFAFESLAPGRFRVRAHLGDRTEDVTEQFDLAHGDVVERTIAMKSPPLRPIRGVVRMNGQLTANGRIEISNRVLHTRSNGTFETELPEGGYSMSVTIGKLVSYKDVEVGASGARLELAFETPAVEPPKPRPIRRQFAGRVVDEHGQPLAGAFVTTDRDTILVTDDAGLFHHESEHESPYVRVQRNGGGSRSGRLEAGRITELRVASRITGQVLTADGRPARAFTIVVRRAQGVVEHSFAQTGGRFRIDDADTPATLTARLGGEDGANTIELDERSPRTNLVLRLRAATTVRGRIIDGVTRQPLAGVRIHARPGVAEWTRWSFTTTDDQGGFAIENVPFGFLVLQLYPSETTWSEQRLRLEVPASGDVGTFTLARVGRR